MTDKQLPENECLSVGYALRPRRASRGHPNYKETTNMKSIEVAAKRQNEDETDSSAKRKKVDGAESLIDELYDENSSPNLNTSRSSTQKTPLASKKQTKKAPTPKEKTPKEKASKEKMPKEKASKASLKTKSAKAPLVKERKKRKTKLERINEKLEALGVMPDPYRGNCARSAIYRGFIKLTGNKSDLDQVVFTGTSSFNCDHNFSATLRQLLEQPDYAGTNCEERLQNATIFCDEKCEYGRAYLTDVCRGDPEFDDGKFHNHCNDCELFGDCIRDYREAHCGICNEHWFKGRSGFPCPCQGEYSDDSYGGGCLVI